MRLSRWIASFLGFPIGGYIAFLTLGSIDDPAAAAVGGAIAGLIIGAAQWLVLRSHGIGTGWIAGTSLAMAAASAGAAALTGSGTEVQDLAVSGLVVGAAVGAAQAVAANMDRLHSAMWTLASSGAWAIGWTVTWSFGIDVDRGFVVFGSSGALVATVLTGLALRQLLSRPPATTLHPVRAADASA
jgi:hypothetical protein